MENQKMVEIITSAEHRKNKTIQIGQHFIYFNEVCVGLVEENLAKSLLVLDESLALVDEELKANFESKANFERKNEFLEGENENLKNKVSTLTTYIAQLEADNKRLKEQIMHGEVQNKVEEAPTVATITSTPQIEKPIVQPPPPTLVSEGKKQELQKQALIALEKQLQEKELVDLQELAKLNVPLEEETWKTMTKEEIITYFLNKSKQS